VLSDTRFISLGLVRLTWPTLWQAKKPTPYITSLEVIPPGGVEVFGVATGQISLSGVAVGTRTVRGIGVAQISIFGSAVGKREVKGVATGTISLTSGVLSVRTVFGVATGSISLTGTATGVGTPPAPEIFGVATGTLTISGSASGVRTVKGIATGLLTIVGTASSVRSVFGSAVGTLTIFATASGYGMLPYVPLTGTVTGTFKFDDSTPAVNTTVTFTPEPTLLLDTTDNVILVTVPITVTVNPGTGVLSKILVATNDANVKPYDWSYRATVVTPAGRDRSFLLKVPAGQTIDLSDSLALAG